MCAIHRWYAACQEGSWSGTYETAFEAYSAAGIHEEYTRHDTIAVWSDDPREPDAPDWVD